MLGCLDISYARLISPSLSSSASLSQDRDNVPEYDLDGLTFSVESLFSPETSWAQSSLSEFPTASGVLSSHQSHMVSSIYSIPGLLSHVKLRQTPPTNQFPRLLKLARRIRNIPYRRRDLFWPTIVELSIHSLWFCWFWAQSEADHHSHEIPGQSATSWWHVKPRGKGRSQDKSNLKDLPLVVSLLQLVLTS